MTCPVGVTCNMGPDVRLTSLVVRLDKPVYLHGWNKMDSLLLADDVMILCHHPNLGTYIYIKWCDLIQAQT